MLNFAWPWMILLLALPLLFRPQQGRGKQSTAIQVPFFAQAEEALHGYQAGTSEATNTHWVNTLILILAWLSLVVAICRPQWQGQPVLLPTEARDLMLAVDISPSMQEQDLLLKGQQANRLEVVKSVVSEFIAVRKGDRIGLILFGAQPYIQVPLTFDLPTVKELLDEATLGIAGNATAIGDAIGLAIKRLRNRPSQSRVLVMLTDGANTGGEVSPDEAAKLAKEAGIKVYTIGVGADEILRRSLFGYRKENPSADLDERLLTRIADTTGGKYFRARNTDQLESIYELINSLEPVEQDERFYRPSSEMYYYPLALASLLLPVYWLLLRAQKYSPAKSSGFLQSAKRIVK
jgi:Ca-activated chloride channel family protein